MSSIYFAQKSPLLRYLGSFVSKIFSPYEIRASSLRSRSGSLRERIKISLKRLGKSLDGALI